MDFEIRSNNQWLGSMNQTTEHGTSFSRRPCVPVRTAFPDKSVTSKPSSSDVPHRAGSLIVNADDWGRDPYTTDRILDCSARGVVSSVSAMVLLVPCFTLVSPGLSNTS